MVPFLVDVSTLSPLDIAALKALDEQQMYFDKEKQAVIEPQSKQYHWATKHYEWGKCIPALGWGPAIGPKICQTQMNARNPQGSSAHDCG